MTCQTCNRHKLKVKKTRDSGQLFIACTGYPSCKEAMNLPKMVTQARMLDELCQDCLKDRGLRVNLLKLDFDSNFVNEDMTEVLPFEDNTSGHFCVVSDEAYHQLVEATRNLPYKRTYSEAFKLNEHGVPNYYYEKPDVGEVPVVKKRAKKDIQIGKDGCPACGKKRHSKLSACPNAAATVT